MDSEVSKGFTVYSLETFRVSYGEELYTAKGIRTAWQMQRCHKCYRIKTYIQPLRVHSFKVCFQLEQSGRFPPWRLYCEILSRLLVYTHTRKHKHTHVHLGDTLDNKNYIKPGTSLDNNNNNTTPFTFMMIITLQVQVYSGHWFESWYIYITYNKKQNVDT